MSKKYILYKNYINYPKEAFTCNTCRKKMPKNEAIGAIINDNKTATFYCKKCFFDSAMQNGVTLLKL